MRCTLFAIERQIFETGQDSQGPSALATTEPSEEFKVSAILGDQKNELDTVGQDQQRAQISHQPGRR